jgi:mono/diheme cytochrome c family protein
MSRMVRLGIRILLILLVAAAALAAGGLAYLFRAYPRVAPPSSVKVESTPARIARGAYLSRHVVGCSDCHGERDWSKYSAPQMREREGHGGMAFHLDIGTLYGPNITPAAIGGWTDGEVLRAMTEGVSKDGRPLFPLMPYEAFAQMSREDAESVIAFIRTLPAVARDIPPTVLKFPMNLIVRTIPKPVTLPASAPDRSDRIAYGRYLTTLASCSSCHTRMVRGRPVPNMTFAGGLEFHPRTGGIQRSANITPDMETGIGRWTEAQFVARFTSIAALDDRALVLNGRRNTEMPWRDYGGMDPQDLSAIYSYLRTVPAVHNAVRQD